jgi:hypothetical protein
VEPGEHGGPILQQERGRGKGGSREWRVSHEGTKARRGGFEC